MLPTARLYLRELAGHADCSGRLCAVGVINGMMQHPPLLRLKPHQYTRCAQATVIYFVSFNCLFSAVNYGPDLSEATASVKVQPLRLGCVCERECALHVTQTCRESLKKKKNIPPPRCLVRRRNP